MQVAIDATLLVHTLTAVIEKARGQRTWLSWSATTASTLLSMTANATHSRAPGFTAGADWKG